MRDHLPRRLRNPLSLRRAILLGIALIIAVYRFRGAPDSATPSTREAPAPPANPKKVDAPRDSCTQWKGCFTGTVAHIADGDTLDVRSGATKYRVRLVLVDAPELATPEGPLAAQQLTSLCPLNSAAAVYPDPRQPKDEYGRTLGVVYCGGKNANAEMIRSGRAQLYGRYCRRSAFGKQDWARELGCHD